MGMQRLERQMLLTDGLSGPEISRRLAAFAHSTRRELIAQDRFSPTFDKWVNGIEGAPEESVKPDGVILYEASYWPEIVQFAKLFAMQRSPEDSGDYVRAWEVFVNGSLWPNDDFTNIPGDSYIWITNTAPYHRKIEVGAMRVEVPPHIVEDTRRAVAAKFRGMVKASVTFLVLYGKGTHPKSPRLPYLLKQQGYRTFAGGALRRARKDMAPGSPISYPTLVLNLP